MNNFKSQRTRVLVATDIAARGIDIDKLSHVFNFDLPEMSETYIHRIGRTGRAGLGGTALSFCDAEERSSLRDINRMIKTSIPVIEDHPFKLSEFESNSIEISLYNPRSSKTSGASRFSKKPGRRWVRKSPGKKGRV